MGVLAKGLAVRTSNSAVTNLDEITRLGFCSQFHFKEAAQGDADVRRDINRSHKGPALLAALNQALVSEKERRKFHSTALLQSLYALKEKGALNDPADLNRILEPKHNMEVELFQKISAIFFPNKVEMVSGSTTTLSPEAAKIAELQSALSAKQKDVDPKLAEYVYRLLKHGFTFHGQDFSLKIIKDEHLIINAKKGVADRDRSPANSALYEDAFRVLTSAEILKRAPHGEAHILNREVLSEGSDFGVLGELARLARAK